MGYFKEDEIKKIDNFLNEKLNKEFDFELIVNSKDLKKEDTLSHELVSMFQHLKKISSNITYSIKYNENNKETDVPVIRMKEVEDRIKFYGVPSGYQFGVFLETIDLIENNNIEDISEEFLEFIKLIDTKINNKIFVIPGCQHCPILTKILITASYLNKNITSKIYYIPDFPDLQKEYNIQGVPTTIVNDEFVFMGVQSENKLIEIYSNVLKD